MMATSLLVTFVIKENVDNNIDYQKGYVTRDILNIYFDKSFYLTGDDISLRDEFYNRIRNKIQSSFPLIESIMIADENLIEIDTLYNTRKNSDDIRPINQHLINQCSNVDTNTEFGTKMYCIDLKYLFKQDSYNSPESLLSISDTSAIERLSDSWQSIGGEQYIFIQYKSSSYVDWLFSASTFFASLIGMMVAVVAIVIVYLQCSLIPEFKNFFEQAKQLTLGKKSYDKTNYKELNSLLNQLSLAVDDQEALRRSTSDAAAASMIHDSKTFLLTILPTLESLIEIIDRQDLKAKKEDSENIRKALLVIKLIKQQTIDSDMVTRYTLLDKSSKAYRPLTHINEPEISLITLIDSVLEWVNFKNSTSNMQVMVVPDVRMHSSYRINQFFVRKCLQSLISNAIKYSTPDDGQEDSRIIILKLGSEPIEFCSRNARLTFQVIDQGAGVPDEVANKMFKEKLTDVVLNKNVTKGLGVDLFYLNETAKETGDELRYVPTSNQRGATFEYAIPSAEHNGFSEFTRPSDAKICITMNEGILKNTLLDFINLTGYEIVTNNICDVLITDDSNIALGFENVLLITPDNDSLFNLKRREQWISLEPHLALADFLKFLSTVEPTKHFHAPALNLEARKGTILLVDDTKEICSANKKTLKSFGFHVVDFNRTAEALSCFKANPHKFDFYVLDFLLNGNDFNGSYLLNELHKITDEQGLKRKPAIALSAHPEDYIVITDKDHGHIFDYYVLKNLIREDLGSTIADLIKDHGLNIRFNPNVLSEDVFYTQSIGTELKAIREKIIISGEANNTNELVKVLKDLQELTHLTKLGSLTNKKVKSWIFSIQNSGPIWNSLDDILACLDEEIEMEAQLRDEIELQQCQEAEDSASTYVYIPSYNPTEIDKDHLMCVHQTLTNMTQENVFVSAPSSANFYASVSEKTRIDLDISLQDYEYATRQASKGNSEQLISYLKRISIYLQIQEVPCLRCDDKIFVKNLLKEISYYLNAETKQPEKLIALLNRTPKKLISDITQGFVERDYLIQQLECHVDQLVFELSTRASTYLAKVDGTQTTTNHIPSISKPTKKNNRQSLSLPPEILAFEQPPEPLK
ncbi:ATP-binding protein [Vibrio nigripulchritudo]|uniref:ATP-binding protein n=1 Tax=Vibrio nigripulchritudo TaxID=28173 RepID=UPI0011AE6935|nr:ATP-binding protein [Vibrio nigripulchritudo]